MNKQSEEFKFNNQTVKIYQDAMSCWNVHVDNQSTYGFKSKEEALKWFYKTYNTRGIPYGGVGG